MVEEEETQSRVCHLLETDSAGEYSGFGLFGGSVAAEEAVVAVLRLHEAVAIIGVILDGPFGVVGILHPDNVVKLS